MVAVEAAMAEVVSGLLLFNFMVHAAICSKLTYWLSLMGLSNSPGHFHHACKVCRLQGLLLLPYGCGAVLTTFSMK